ncbi:fibronectin type III domain-containing protein 10-like [Hippocampus comes]|uniref:fibronectin type III domain-containing protein 10-like n=2 Tax=Hippocampus comes TaxID=109280 RepID=UPI00094E5A81|nr:PREDICTED: fibronectin type III domain-containing protein 10-like [Hippocampus comes]
MSSQQRPSVLALATLLLCTAQHRTHGSGSASSSTSASPSEVTGREDSGMQRRWLKHHGNSSQESRPWQKASSLNASAVTSVKRSPLSGASSPLCAYQVTEGGIGGPLCFRHMLAGYTCHEGDCRRAVSSGSLVANILINGSVLLQWSQGREVSGVPGSPDQTRAPGAKSSSIEKTNSIFSGRRHRHGGYELSCWWNGSYTQFECAGVHLGSGCRDFLLSELHQNIPYRICLRSLDQRADHKDCVEFILPPSGMQDIVIAMTTVGGAICVMLVIICLLVAYITENIMSPATQHTYSYRTHSRH